MTPRIPDLAMLVCLSAVAGCTASASATPDPPPGCGRDSSIPCSQGVGWSCSAGDNPEIEQANLSCSIPTPNGPNDDFCCFEWTHGSTCTPDDGLTSVCRPGSYGFRCQAGDDPTSLDPSLNCSSPTPDGPDDDFCCN